jgi:hypothetical protein
MDVMERFRRKNDSSQTGSLQRCEEKESICATLKLPEYDECNVRLGVGHNCNGNDVCGCVVIVS